MLTILAANVALFMICAHEAASPAIPSDTLYAFGAITSSTLARHDYWRLLAAGFLHVDPVHLIMNMISLVILGPHLERRLGESYFALIYLAALLAGATASILLHKQAFVGVGASGAIYGIFAALMALWIMGESDLPGSFFAINLALNAMFAMRMPNLDWAAHLGGFAGGFIATTVVVDLVERRNLLRLRCKLPEFAKFNTIFLMLAPGAWLLLARPALLAGLDWRAQLGSALLAAYLLLRLVDLALSKQHGLAEVVAILALGNAAAAAALARYGVGALEVCAYVGDAAGLLEWVCDHSRIVAALAGLLALLLTLLFDADELKRGLGDKGFIARGFLAERQRRRV